MESTTLKAENLKPVILKAGVPLAVSLAGLIYAWIMAKKSLSKASSFQENEADTPQTNCHHQGTKHEESFHNLSSMEDDYEEPATPTYSSVLSGSSVIHDNHPCLEQEIAGLRSQTEGLQMRELALRLQFDQYCEIKEQESLLMEIKNMLSLETAHVEFLDREISFIETETMRLEIFVVQYLRIIEQLGYWKSENRMLQKKVQKLLRKSKAQSHLIKEQNLKIKEEEAEILRNRDALQTRISVIDKLEDEIRELQRVSDQLQDEKDELLKKIDTAETHASKEQLHRKPLKYYLQVESGVVRKEDYNQLLNELEQVKKERATEVEEVIHLRRINACLRQESMRNHEQQQQQQDQSRDHMVLEFEGSGGVMQYDSEHELHCSFLKHHNVSCISSAHGDRAFSKRKRLLKRLKRWVEGSEKARLKPDDKSSHEIKSVGGHSVTYGSETPEVPATPRFCSSA